MCLPLIVLGCQPAEPGAEPKPPQAASAAPAPTEDGGGGIGIVSPAAGGMSPVLGSDSVGGGGSGVGTAMKAKARDIAAGGVTSLNSGETAESGE